jgi:hypothetical protein
VRIFDLNHVLKQAGKVLAWKDKEDQEGDPWILIRFSPDHSPEGIGFFPEFEYAGGYLGLRLQFLKCLQSWSANEAGDEGCGGDRLFAAPLLRRVAFEGVHLAEAGCAPWQFKIFPVAPQSRDGDTGRAALGVHDPFHVIDNTLAGRAVGSGDQVLVARVFPQQGALPGVDRDDPVARGEGMGCVLGGHTGLVETVMAGS